MDHVTDDNEDQPARDERGRWRKGCTSPYPKGRPRKQRVPKVPTIDRTDVLTFANEMMEVTLDGEQQLASRHELVHRQLFNLAMKGNAQAAVHLHRQFRAAADMEGEMIARTLQLIQARRENPDAFTAMDEKALEMGLARFERMMNPPIPAELQQQLDEEFEVQVRAKQARKAQLEEGDEVNGDDR